MPPASLRLKAVAMMAPTVAPSARRPMRPRGAVRLGVLGSLSAMYSPTAAALSAATAAGCAIQEAHVPWTGSFPLLANQEVTASGVTERRPVLTPRRVGARWATRGEG